MLQNLRNRARSEEGFTLIELLVVILIIGILAAIALPTFLGQRAKAQDSSAKSNARNMVSEIESCYTDSADYQSCDTVAELKATTGLPLVDGVPAAKSGNVGVSGAAVDGYTITAASKSGNTFTIKRTAGGPVARTCATDGDAGCPSGGKW